MASKLDAIGPPMFIPTPTFGYRPEAFSSGGIRGMPVPVVPIVPVVADIELEDEAERKDVPGGADLSAKPQATSDAN